MDPVKMVAVFAENRPGWLARVTQVLAAAGLNIQWLGIASVERFGVIRVLVDRADVACAELQSAGFTVSLVDVLAVEADDKPGSLHEVAQLLSDRGVSLQNCSGFVVNGRAILLLEAADPAQAAQVLAAGGARLLDAGALRARQGR